MASRKKQNIGARKARKKATAGDDMLKKYLRGRVLAACVVVLLAAYAAQAITSMRRKSVTSDEMIHLAAGYTYYKTADYRINPEHPTLIKMLAALPLLTMDINGGFDGKAWELKVIDRRGKRRIEEKEWVYGWLFMYHWNDADTLIFWGRLVLVVMSLGAGLLVFFWARELYGSAAGVFALFLFCFSPNIIAHSRLVNTDMGLAFFCLLALYCFDRALRRITLLRVLIAGIALGAALLSKYSSLPILPVFFILALIRIIQKMPLRTGFGGGVELAAKRKRLLPVLAVCAAVSLVAWGVIWAGYGFKFRAMESDDEEVQHIIRTTPPMWKSLHYPYRLAMENKLLPQAYLFGFQYITYSTAGRASFLDGRHGIYGWRHYFIMTFLYKTPVPTLILLGISILFSFWLSRGRWLSEMPLIIFFLVVYGIALAGKINIGHRHILPVLLPVFIFVSKLVNYVGRRGGKYAVVFAVILVALSAWYAAGSVLIWPDYLAYFNEPSGGPDEGYKHLTDSNIEWGQDLVLLKEFMDERDIKRVHLGCLGSADPNYYGIEYDWIFGFFYRRELRTSDNILQEVDYYWEPTWVPNLIYPKELKKIKKGDWVVVGVSHYMDTILPRPVERVSAEETRYGLLMFLPLRKGKLKVGGKNYYGNIGHSLLVFHMKEDLDIFTEVRDFYKRTWSRNRRGRK